jgi:hypothetical protein
MKGLRSFATVVLTIVALASCEKFETVGYNSDSGRVEEKTSTKQLLMNAAPTIQLDTVFLSVVPAHKDDDGIFRDGKGLQKATKCLFVKYNNGCKIVVFDAVLPSIEEVANAPLLEGDMTGYDSAYYDGSEWLPAFAEDYENGIQYGVFSSTKSGRDYPRTIVNKTLPNRGWENVYDGRFSTRLDGYTVSVENGKLVVSYNETSLILE